MTGSPGKPRIILGLLTFGPPGSEEYGTRISSLTDFQECLDTFKNRGYNEVDTARTYVNGLQEAFTREAQWQERGLSMATKWFPFNAGEHAASVVKQQLEKSLSELGCEKVDTFYLHAPDRSVPFKETLQACDELYRAGKFERLGLSNYAAWEVAEICTLARENGWVQPRLYQAMYNALTRAIEEELIPCCRKFALSIIAYNPLAGGVLSGKYSQANDAPTKGRFSNVDPVVGDMYRKRYFRDENFEALRLLQPLAEKHGLSLPEIAFRWCVHHSKLDMLEGGDGVVIGVSSLAQLEANLRDLEKEPLPEVVVQALDEAWESYTKRSCPLYWR